MSPRVLTIALSASLLSPALLEAQTAPAAPAEQTPAEVVAATQPVAAEVPAPALIIADAKPAAAVEKTKDTLSVDFPDEEIRTILRNVADLFELNLVIPDTLIGRTSIKLRDVTWRQIFQVSLSPVGYTFIEDGNIIKVVSLESLQQEPVTTEVFILNYAAAGDIKASIEALIDNGKGGKLVVDVRSNALVITERPSAMGHIRPIIEKLDKATDQVMIESKFLEVSNRDAKDVGVNWESLGGYGVSGGPFSKSYSNTTGRQTTNSHSEKNIDVDFMQDGYERADILTNRNNPSGTNTNPTTGLGPAYTIDDDTGQITYDDIGPSSSITSLLTGDVSRVTTAVFSADQFSLVLSALKTNSDTKLVSNPTVVTLNNSEASINIGEEYPIPSYTYNQEQGSFEVSGFEYRPIGIILKVTPQVNSRGFIKLSIEPEVSSRSGTTTFGGASGAEIPIISTRKTKTQVSMKDGFTMGIGGLIENTTTEGETRVPVLGSIPVLGRLFRSNSTSEDRRNLLVFITAKTVSAEGASIEETFDPRAIRQMGITRDELPGYREASDPFAANEEARKKKNEKKKPFFRLTRGKGTESSDSSSSN